MDIKKILGARTSKKLATLLSLSAIALPLVGCTPKEKINEEEHKKLDISFCDTSNISASNFYDGYAKSYAEGYTTYIIDQMEDIKKVYNKLRTIPGTYKEENDGITFNFDGTVMPYESNDGYFYYANDEIIKEIFYDSVWLKTADGYIRIKEDDDSYIITNCNENKGSKTEITYKSDKSCLINEKNENCKIVYEYDENGRLVYSKISNSDHTFEEKTYVDGNFNMYSYKNEKYEKELKKDGSYIIIERGYRADSKRLGYDLDLLPGASNIKYYYDRNEKLDHVDELYDQPYFSGRTIAFPNGQVFSIEEKHDENGNLIYCKKKEQLYDIQTNSRKFETILMKQTGNDGNEHTILSKYDYTLTSPYNILNNDKQVGDTVYLCEDGVTAVDLKDGFIYKYNDGNFYEAYKVDGKTIKYADKDGNIIRILNDKEDIGYIDYENNIKKYVENLGEDEITAEFNGENYVLEKDGSISYNNDNSVITYNKNKDIRLTKYLEEGYSELCTPSETIKYDADDKITSISRENYYVSYYDYDKNIIHVIKENGIYKEFFEDGCNVKLIKNMTSEEPYIYDGYELKLGSKLEFNDNRSLREYYFDDTKYIKNNNNGDCREKKEDGTLYEYNPLDNTLRYTIQNVDDPDNAVKTEYYDYENNIIDSISDSQKVVHYYRKEPGYEQPIASIKNISEEPLTVYDAEGKEYVLNQDDYIYYHQNNHISSLKQGEVEYVYLSQTNSEYYWEVPAGEYWKGTAGVLYHNDEILYEGTRSNLHMYHNANGDIEKIAVNGEIIEEQTQQIELAEQENNAIEIQDDER